jgi:hypothetical protein
MVLMFINLYNRWQHMESTEETFVPASLLCASVLLEVLCASVLVKFGLENRDYGRRGSAALTMRHPSIRKSWH